MSEDDNEWFHGLMHEVKVVITQSVVNDRPQESLCEVYQMVAYELSQHSDRLQRSVEKQIDGLAN